jgi:hypothetical protein
VRSRSCVLELNSITISVMRIAIAWAVLILLNPAFSFAQTRPKSTRKADADRMGMTCPQILQMSSSEWIAKVASTSDSSEDAQLRGIRSYGKCYDERTDRLAVSFARSRKGPSLRARSNFRDLLAALDDFTSKALADSQPPGDAVKKAYTALYEKQFRYAFYQSYEAKASAPGHATAGALEPASAPKNGPAAGTPPANVKPSAAPLSDMTRAKNRFGELLDALPPDKLHEMHEAFGKVVEVQPIASAQELAIYHYAIFALEPSAPRAGATKDAPAAKPFAPPPF